MRFLNWLWFLMNFPITYRIQDCGVMLVGNLYMCLWCKCICARMDWVRMGVHWLVVLLLCVHTVRQNVTD